MSVFGNDARLFFTIETPIYKEQCDIVSSELEEMRNNVSDKWDQMFFKYYQHVTAGSNDSFVLNFDDSVLSLSNKEQLQLEESMHDLMMSTDWLSSWTLFYSIEQEVEGYSKEKIINEKIVETYVDSVIECGYNVSLKSLNSIFGSKITSEEINKLTLFNRINHVNKWID